MCVGSGLDNSTVHPHQKPGLQLKLFWSSHQSTIDLSKSVVPALSTNGRRGYPWSVGWLRQVNRNPPCRQDLTRKIQSFKGPSTVQSFGGSSYGSRQKSDGLPWFVDASAIHTNRSIGSPTFLLRSMLIRSRHLKVRLKRENNEMLDLKLLKTCVYEKARHNYTWR